LRDSTKGKGYCPRTKDIFFHKRFFIRLLPGQVNSTNYIMFWRIKNINPGYKNW
jgi:hypothetical protein